MMRVDRMLPSDLAELGDAAEVGERLGYDCLWVSEVDHDPFVSCTLAATRTARTKLGTAIAVAFARSPMSTAYLANDLQTVSGGRFVLGLGSQVEAHVTRRFSMPWSRPAARMREYVLAMRAIWASWHDGAPLDFQGDFYLHTLMPPFFSPGLNEHGTPPVLVAGVGERMTEVAGEVGDGFLFHAFTTERYLRERTLPALRAGRHRADADLEGFEITGPVLVVTGTTEEDLRAALAATRSQLAFYALTPAYRGVLELHGWGELHDEVRGLVRAGRSSELGDTVDDEMLQTFAVVGEPAHLAGELRRRYGGLASSISLYTPYSQVPAELDHVARDCRSAAAI